MPFRPLSDAFDAIQNRSRPCPSDSGWVVHETVEDPTVDQVEYARDNLDDQGRIDVALLQHGHAARDRPYQVRHGFRVGSLLGQWEIVFIDWIIGLEES